MNHTQRSLVIAAFVLSGALGLRGTSWAQDPTPKPQDLYREIAGVFEFERDGKVLVLEFSEKDGKLLAAPSGEAPQEAVPVTDRPMTFDVTVPDSGRIFRLLFMRNEKKVIDRCVMRVASMEIIGTRKPGGLGSSVSAR